jgi:hypothetical protein
MFMVVKMIEDIFNKTAEKPKRTGKKDFIRHNYDAEIIKNIGVTTNANEIDFGEDEKQPKPKIRWEDTEEYKHLNWLFDGKIPKIYFDELKNKGEN